MPKRRDIPELSNISPNQLDNHFEVLSDENGRYFYDLSDTIIIDTENMSPLYYHEYVVQENDTLVRLAIEFYSSANLYWVIAVSNNINNPFVLDSGTVLRIPKKEILGQILTEIENNS